MILYDIIIFYVFSISISDCYDTFGRGAKEEKQPREGARPVNTARNKSDKSGHEPCPFYCIKRTVTKPHDRLDSVTQLLSPRISVASPCPDLLFFFFSRQQ